MRRWPLQYAESSARGYRSRVPGLAHKTKTFLNDNLKKELKLADAVQQNKVTQNRKALNN